MPMPVPSPAASAVRMPPGRIRAGFLSGIGIRWYGSASITPKPSAGANSAKRFGVGGALACSRPRCFPDNQEASESTEARDCDKVVVAPATVSGSRESVCDRGRPVRPDRDRFETISIGADLPSTASGTAGECTRESGGESGNSGRSSTNMDLDRYAALAAVFGEAGLSSFRCGGNWRDIDSLEVFENDGSDRDSFDLSSVVEKPGTPFLKSVASEDPRPLAPELRLLGSNIAGTSRPELRRSSIFEMLDPSRTCCLGEAGGDRLS